MKCLYFFLVLTLLSSCNSNSKKSESDKSINASDSLTEKEAEYLKTRDAYIEQFKPLQKAGPDTLDRMDDRARLQLEKMLYEILKDSKFSTQGKNNLITLRGYMGFGMADGLSFQKDSMTIFYTSKNLFINFYKGRVKHMRELSQDDLQLVFLWTVLKYAFPTNFFSTRIVSPKGYDTYLMIAQVGNGVGLGPPHHLFALVFADQFTYVIGKDLRVPIKELPQCKEISDRIDTANFDTVFELYRKCYQTELANDPQFEAIKKKLESMVKYIEP